MGWFRSSEVFGARCFPPFQHVCHQPSSLCEEGCSSSGKLTREQERTQRPRTLSLTTTLSRAPCPPQVIFTPRWPRFGDLPPLPSHCQRLGSDRCLLIGVSRGPAWTGTAFSGPGSLRTRGQRRGRRRSLGLPSAPPSSLLRKPRPRQHPAGDPGAAPRPGPPGGEAASGTTVPRDPHPNRLAHADWLAAPSISHPATGRRLLTALNGQSRQQGAGAPPADPPT